VRYAARTTAAAPRLNLLVVIYLVAGAIVAATHHYFTHLHTIQQFGSAILAILLWPLIFLGISLHVH
jgi:ABC-type Na+ efflux pump permease subunit